MLSLSLHHRTATHATVANEVKNNCCARVAAKFGAVITMANARTAEARLVNQASACSSVNLFSILLA